MDTLLIAHPDCALHEMGGGHPESPERLRGIFSAIEHAGLKTRIPAKEATSATREALKRAHRADYVDWVFENAPKQGYAYLDPDTAMNPKTLSAAVHAAGAVVQGVDAVMKGDAPSVFCAVRPPGHHATKSRAMGFCVFNNVAVGALHALEHHRLKRVAVLDFDVHHGNGTEDIFANDPRVMLCSSFQHPFYPYSGADTVSNHIINTPLPAGTGSQGFRKAVEDRWLPALDAFKPELIIISAGFDAHRDDPLAYLELEERDYVWVTRAIKEVAKQHAQSRIVSSLEGGYNVGALGSCVVEHVKALQ